MKNKEFKIAATTIVALIIFALASAWFSQTSTGDVSSGDNEKTIVIASSGKDKLPDEIGEQTEELAEGKTVSVTVDADEADHVIETIRGHGIEVVADRDAFELSKSDLEAAIPDSPEENAISPGQFDKNSPDIVLIDTGSPEDHPNIIGYGSTADGTSSFFDEHGHGTNMVKAICSQAPDVSIYSIRVTGQNGKASISSVAKALSRAEELHPKVVCFSMSADDPEVRDVLSSLVSELSENGISVVAAAGNNGKDANTTALGGIEDAVVVGACDIDGNVLASSNFGESVDYYASAESTSYAAAIVAALLASDQDLLSHPGVFDKDIRSKTQEAEIVEKDDIPESVSDGKEPSGENKEETSFEPAAFTAPSATISWYYTTNSGSSFQWYPAGTYNDVGLGWQQGYSCWPIIVVMNRSLGSVPDGDIQYRTKCQFQSWGAWKSNGAQTPNPGGSGYAVDAMEIKLTGTLNAAYSISYGADGWGGYGSWGSSDGGTVGYTSSQSGRWIQVIYIKLNPRTTNQTVQARFENADGSWSGYSAQRTTAVASGNAVDAWSRGADATYQAASIGSWYACGPATKYVSVYRRTATNTIRVRYQNADGSWGSYSNASSGTDRVGATRSWSRSADATYQAASASITGTASNQTKDVSIYRNQRTITINPNGGSWNNTTSNTSMTQCHGYTQSIAAPVRPGYTFTGWTVGSSSINTSGAATVTYDSTKTLVAKWTANSYSVAFDGNGGNVSGTSSFTQNYATSVTAPSATRTGYTFKTWVPVKSEDSNWIEVLYQEPSVAWFGNKSGALSKNDRGAFSMIGQIPKLKKDGKWEYLQTADEKSGQSNRWRQTNDITQTSPAADANSASGFEAVSLSWGASSFKGLVNKADNGSTYAAYAVGNAGYWWHAVGQYAIYQGGNPWIADGSFVAKQPIHLYVLSDSSLSNVDRSLSTGTTAGTSVPVRAESQLFKALWQANSYSVRYNANGGSGTMNMSSHTYDVEKNLSGNAFDPPTGKGEGYSFQGWATTLERAKAGEVDYTDAQPVTNLASANGEVVDLYAVWKRTVTFKSGKNQATVKTAEQYYDAGVTVPEGTGTVSGWDLAGWREDAVAAAPSLDAQGTISPESDEVYAVYTRTLTVSYDANSGNGIAPEASSATQYYNSAPSISTPEVTLAANSFEKTNYAFLKWNLGSAGGRASWTPNVDDEPNTTAEAQWRFSAEATGIDGKNPDGNNDGYGDNISFSTPSSVSAVLRPDGTLMFPSNAQLSNLSGFDIKVSSLDVDAASGWVITDDIEHVSSSNIVQISIGMSGYDPVEAADYATKTALGAAWLVPDGQTKILSFAGIAKNVRPGSTNLADMCDIQWYVRADL